MKRIVLVLLLLTGYTAAQACTVCGCSASNQYLGILPQFQKHFIGLQYQYRTFETTHPPTGEGIIETSKEYYSTLQVWGRYNPTERIQLFAFIPYISNLRTENGQTDRISGLGDITLLANYQLLRGNISPKLQHNLQLGGGVKLPTGAYDKEGTRTLEGLPNMQPGTNSWDFIANANYTLRSSKAGVNADVSYTITTPNQVHYKFGNRLSAGVLGFYWYETPKIILLPQAGLRFDLAGSDWEHYRNGWKNDMSGGEQFYLSMGLQTYYGRLGAQLMYHHPLHQHYASGLVNTRFKTEAGILYLF